MKLKHVSAKKKLRFSCVVQEPRSRQNTSMRNRASCPLSDAIAKGAANGLRLRMTAPLTPSCFPGDPVPRKSVRVDQTLATDLAFLAKEVSKNAFFETRIGAGPIITRASSRTSFHFLGAAGNFRFRTNCRPVRVSAGGGTRPTRGGRLWRRWRTGVPPESPQ